MARTKWVSRRHQARLQATLELKRTVKKACEEKKAAAASEKKKEEEQTVVDISPPPSTLSSPFSSAPSSPELVPHPAVVKMTKKTLGSSYVQKKAAEACGCHLAMQDIRKGYLAVFNNNFAELSAAVEGDFSKRFRTDVHPRDKETLKYPFYELYTRTDKRTDPLKYDLPVNAVMACIGLQRNPLLKKVLATKPQLNLYDEEDIDELTLALRAYLLGFRGSQTIFLTVLSYYRKNRYHPSPHLLAMIDDALPKIGDKEVHDRLVNYLARTDPEIRCAKRLAKISSPPDPFKAVDDIIASIEIDEDDSDALLVFTL